MWPTTNSGLARVVYYALPVSRAVFERPGVALRALPDVELVAAMRAGESAAWREFDARFHPLLESYARKARIPRWEWSTCVADVLGDEAIRLAGRPVEVPNNLSAYLVRAVRNRFLRLKRSTSCRDRYYGEASDDFGGEWVVTALCSEEALRASAGPDARSVEPSIALRRLALELRAGLSDEERLILDWLSQGASHREIAQWLGSTYEACTKRIWRLCRRLRSQATHRVADYPGDQRAEVDRFLRRAGAMSARVAEHDIGAAVSA